MPCGPDGKGLGAEPPAAPPSELGWSEMLGRCCPETAEARLSATDKTDETPRGRSRPGGFVGFVSSPEATLPCSLIRRFGDLA
jgi:hypothetical protein